MATVIEKGIIQEGLEIGKTLEQVNSIVTVLEARFATVLSSVIDTLTQRADSKALE